MSTRLELRSIKIIASMSEETPCYSGRLFFDGQHIADVSNRGHGGPDEVCALRGCEVALDAAIAYVKTMPPVCTDFGDLAMDLELWCHTEVGKVEGRKEILRSLRKDLKRAVVYVRDGGIYVMTYKGVKQIGPQHIAHFKAKHPELTILNELPEAEAFEIYAPLVLQEG
jgi:hypothetical protein